MKYALVTGGSRGIGRAVCIRLARMGYHVLVNYANRTDEAETTLELIRQTGQGGELLGFDVSDGKQARAALEGWQDAHPDEYIEVLVNNAGIRRDNILALMPEEDWHRVIDIALDGFYNVTQPLLQPMMFHKYGRIINVARVSGLKGMPGHVNMIPLNDVRESPLKPSRRIRQFQQRLESHGVTATVRRSLGGDIDASCGQLRRKAMEDGEDKRL